jgi:hypothetical protein
MHLPFYHQTSTASMLMQAIVVVCMVGSSSKTMLQSAFL